MQGRVLQLKQSLPRLLVTFAVAAGFLLLAQPASALSLSYPRYDVDIVVNQDSTVDVTETMTVRFVGTARGVLRNITLENRSRDCSSTGRTCGGFERLALLGVYDTNGDLVSPSLYEMGIEEDEDTEIKTFNIKWVVWDEGKLFSGTEDFTWTVKYRLYGSIGFIGETEQAKIPYLYWNALPENRGGVVDRTKINIAFPPDVNANSDRLEVFADGIVSYDYIVDENRLTISAEDLLSTGNFTVIYELPRNSIDKPATLQYFGSLPWVGTGLILDGVDLGDIGGVLNSLPTGDHEATFYHFGYESKTVEFSVVSGELVKVDATLNPTPLMWIILIINILLNIAGVILIPVAILYVYIKWRQQGRDINLPATFIPLFHPPKNVHPYLLGSLKDEQVDREDVTGSIIDLAFRGYIKIKELDEGKNYELTRLEGKAKDEGLNDFETQLLSDIFGGEESVETKKLGDKFYMKYPALQQKIYKEMVDRGYFRESPQTTRAKYAGCGTFVIMFGMLEIIFISLGALGVVGVIGPLFLGIALAVLGISFITVAKYMPAKTAEGSKVYAEVMGFRMYMYHAERYRVQGLSPEEFEKYLSYAIVFGIEKDWADKFKDIYKGQPDWYDGTSAVYDAYWYSRFTRSFADSFNSSAYTPVSTGSASGGGWSGGGGSFGGFSGGGGGGGSSGGF
jgi:uncharacterized membrane protein YgcG